MPHIHATNPAERQQESTDIDAPWWVVARRRRQRNADAEKQARDALNLADQRGFAFEPAFEAARQRYQDCVRAPVIERASNPHRVIPYAVQAQAALDRARALLDLDIDLLTECQRVDAYAEIESLENDAELAAERPDYWAGSPRVLRLRAALASAQAEHSAMEQQMREHEQEWPSSKYGATPEWTRLVTLLRESWDVMRAAEKALYNATQYRTAAAAREARDFHDPKGERRRLAARQHRAFIKHPDRAVEAAQGIVRHRSRRQATHDDWSPTS
jgi:hypothetical protein